MPTVNSVLRLLLAIWVIGFLLVSCVPMLSGNATASGFGILAGAILLVPWLIGVVILVVLVWLTNPRAH